jgi:hypothetical protein
MNGSTSFAKLSALFLSVLFLSCSVSRQLVPANADDLTRFVLLIREMPDGQIAHSWHYAESFDLSRYRYHASTPRPDGRILLVAARKRDCHEEYLECHRACRRARLPPGYGHIPRGSVRHDSFCWDKCKQPYEDCEKLQELQPQEFTAMDGAVDWLKRNHKAVFVGGLIVIAGVVFVVVSAGAGLVILAPAALVAT